jgi:hypothetical protein
MSPNPQVSAAAASNSYTDLSQRDVERQQSVSLESKNDYTVFGYKNDPVTGFHATAYREVAPPHNIIIAYRGTDPDFHGHKLTMAQDIAVDATMVRDAVNPQKGEASAFTAEMIDKAARLGIPKEQVTVAGHSLGGTLAEIEAAKFGLHGTTLNAYGAEGLTDGPPAPGCQLTNYRMAGDPVSAANAHIGTVVPLASPEDVASLQAGRYLHAPAGSAPPNPLLAMRGADHSGDHFTGADGHINVLDPAVMADYQQRYKDNQAGFDRLSGDLHRERGELATALRQMESGKRPVNLPPEIQWQVNEYLAVNVDPAVQKAIEQNANVTGVEHGVQHGADGVRAGSHYVQTQDERAATAARAAGNFVAPVAPLAPLAGAAFGEAAHLHGQAVHAVGDYAANTLESAKQTVELGAHNVSRTAQGVIHNPEFQAAAVGVVNRIVDTYGRAEATGHAVEQSYESAKRAVSQGIDDAEHSASQAYNTVTHPLQSLESAVASQVSADMSPAVDPTRRQQRALHGESSQVDRAHEAQRQQEVQGHSAAHEAPLPPAPAAISPGSRTSEREASPSRQDAARDQEAQAPRQARHEPTTAPAAPDHAALAAQQAHQQAMHAQRHA